MNNVVSLRREVDGALSAPLIPRSLFLCINLEFIQAKLFIDIFIPVSIYEIL